MATKVANLSLSAFVPNETVPGIWCKYRTQVFKKLHQIFIIMKKTFKIVAFVVITTLIITSCKEDERCSIHPEPFRFSIIEKETGTDLLDNGAYNPEEIGIHYFANDERKDLIVNRETDPDTIYIELVTVQLPMISLTGLSDIFYLELGTDETDTLMVALGMEERGGCDYHPYTTVIHNGQHIDIVEEKAFILKK